MARPKNTIETESMTISVTPQMKYYLEQLALEGIYGGVTSQDVVRYLVNKSVQDLIREKMLTPVQWRSTGDGGVEVAGQAVPASA